MSNMQNSYLTDLLQKASEYRTRELQAERKQALTGMQPRREPTRTNITPTRKPLVEPDTRNKIVKGTEITNIFEAAKQYNPFATTKTEAQLKEPLTYLSKLKSDTVISALGDQLNATGTMTQGEEAKLNSWKQMDSLQQQINNLKRGIPVKGGSSGNHRFSYYKKPTSNQLQEVEKLQIELNNMKQYHPESISERNKLIRDWNNLKTINKEILTPQQTTLSNLVAEQEKYFGKDFANISKEQLVAADWTAWQNLSGDIAKYTSLRDSYINKYKADPSKYNKDWIIQYNDLITKTATSMTSEIPKILNSASTAITSIKESQRSSLAALEALNRVSGVQTQQRKNIPSEMDVAPIGRQQAIARQQMVSKYSEQSKPAPRFTSRPI